MESERVQQSWKGSRYFYTGSNDFGPTQADDQFSQDTEVFGSYVRIFCKSSNQFRGDIKTQSHPVGFVLMFRNLKLPPGVSVFVLAAPMIFNTYLQVKVLTSDASCRQSRRHKLFFGVPGLPHLFTTLCQPNARTVIFSSPEMRAVQCELEILLAWNRCHTSATSGRAVYLSLFTSMCTIKRSETTGRCVRKKWMKKWVR